jgi:hypothetical protein
MIKTPVSYNEAGIFVDANGQSVLTIFGWSRNVKSKNDAIGEQIVTALNAKPQHLIECNYYPKPIGYPGCICSLVNRNDHAAVVEDNARLRAMLESRAAIDKRIEQFRSAGRVTGEDYAVMINAKDE